MQIKAFGLALAIMLLVSGTLCAQEAAGQPGYHDRAYVQADATAIAAYPRFALKTNALHWASASFNLAGEIAVSRRSSLELYWGWNPFDWKGNKKWKHWIVQPAYRWWLCESFDGAFFGAHLHGGMFNAGGAGPFTTIRNNRYEGYFYGAGISFGHRWILSCRLSLEAEIGAGYARMEYDKYGCAECAPKQKKGHYNYFGPTRAAVSLAVALW